MQIGDYKNKSHLQEKISKLSGVPPIMKWRVHQQDTLRKINYLANAGCPNDECYVVIFTTKRTAEKLRYGGEDQVRFISKWESCNVVFRIMYLVFDI